MIAPASPPRSQETYENGLSRLRKTYDVRSFWQPGQERGYLSAPDLERVNALHWAIQDPEIRAIFCVRGGYGSLRLLPHIDWELARQHSTLLVGYSDITVLHLAFYKQARWPGLSGPVVTEWAKMDSITEKCFRALSKGKPRPLPARLRDSLEPIVPGQARGLLLGGNLSVLSRLIGTPYLPDFEGAILVLEEVSEVPYRVDRMLAHLQHAGILDAVSGVILGHFVSDDATPAPSEMSFATVLNDYLGARSYPVVRGLPYGHRLPRCTLPLGGRVELRSGPDSASLKALHPIVSPQESAGSSQIGEI